MKPAKCLVTGGAGFIGSHLVDRLLADGHTVTAYDNLSTGRESFLEVAKKNKRFTLVRGDLKNAPKLQEAMAGCDIVFHMAANADVRHGTAYPGRDLEQNTIVTYGVLECMRMLGIKKIAFPSTGSVYGEPKIFPTPETAPFPMQTSFYGASKLACEGLIQAYAEGFGLQAWIFRFVSILGERYTHGHLIDFYRHLKKDPATLPVLGDGHQKKSYLYVGDCVEAMMRAIDKASELVNIFNLGTDEHIEVNDSIKWISEYMKIEPKVSYAGGERGWIGDSPFIFLDCAKIRSLGWKPKLSIKDAVKRTLEYFQQHSKVVAA